MVRLQSYIKKMKYKRLNKEIKNDLILNYYTPF